MMPKKRRRDVSATETQLVEIYEDLANLEETIRLRAAHSLLTYLNAGSSTDDNGQRLDSVFNRLTRGLCSGRKAARVGFSVALTELLTYLTKDRQQGVPCFHNGYTLLKTLQCQTTVSHGVSAQEDRDHLLGRIFGAEAFIRSGIVFRGTEDDAVWAEVVDMILQIASHRTWPREECGYVLYASLEDSCLPNHDPRYAALILEKIRVHRFAKTPEGVAIWIAVQSKYPAATLPSGVWHHDDPLNSRNKAELARVLKEVSTVDQPHDESQKAAQTGRWQAKIHFAWHAVLAQIIPRTQATLKVVHKSPGRISLQDFWLECVDSLFAAASSQERKYWGFLLFEIIIAKSPRQIISSMFSQNFMPCFMNHLALTDRYLHRAAEKTRKAVVNKIKSDSFTTMPILAALLTSPHGDINFDLRTKTKTIETGLAHAAIVCPYEIIELYQNTMLQPLTQDDKIAESRRKLLTDQLVSVLCSYSRDSERRKDSSVYVQQTLSLLAKFAYCDLNSLTAGAAHHPIPAISPSSRSMFRARLFSCLTYLSKVWGIISNLTYSMLRDLHESKQVISWGGLLLNADMNIKRVIDETLATLSYMNDENCAQRIATHEQRQSVSILLSMSMLQVHNGDAGAVSGLEDLNEIFDKKRLVQLDSDEIQDSTAFVEIILSLLSKPSLLVRRVSRQVFAAFAGGISLRGLMCLTRVLETAENSKGQREIFDEEDDRIDAISGSEAEAEEEETGSGNSPSIISFDEQQSQGSEDNDVYDATFSSQGDLDDQELADFDAKLAHALGTRPGQEDIDADNNSSPDETVDDEEMEKLDKQLESVFRERRKVKSRQNEQKDAKERMINFKCRVLELLDVYIKQEHANIQALKLILPILVLLRKTCSPLISSKASNLIRDYSRLCRGKGVAHISSSDPVIDILQSVHDEAGKEASNAHASACSQASLLLVRVLVSFDRECLRQIVGIYANTQERALFEPGFKTRASMFTDWTNWCNNNPKY